jgi:hypothetical protein
MAGETLYSSNITVAAAVDAEIVPMFTSASIMAGLVAPFAVGMANTNAKRLPKSGSITASVVSESNAASPQVLTDTSVLLTLQKAVVVTKPTIEAVRFATNGTNVQRHAALSAQACSVKFDTDALALATSVTLNVDTGAAATVAGLQQAAYSVRNGNIPYSNLAFVGNYKQLYQIEGDIRSSGNAIYGNPNFSLGAVNSTQARMGFKGQLFGVDLYETGVNATASSNNVGLVFNPQLAIAALYPAGSAPGFETSISEELGFLESVSFIKTIMWYQVALYNDAAACRLLSDV